MKAKALLNLLPIVLIGIGGFTFYQHWQQQAAAQPDYDNSNTPQKVGLAPVPGQSQVWQVAGVSDGDTLTVRSGTKKERIRLCGIDAPEKEQPFGNESRDRLRSLLVSAGNQVIVTPIERDRYDRLVAEVFVKAPTPQQPELEKFINYEMVATGLAYHYARYSDSCPNQQNLVEGEVEAQRLHRGVWSKSNLMKPWEYRQQKRER